ncbi:MAG: pilus assembly PilX N-terminal domain-containing protein [Desulfotomaculaceae bacterium]|nr:pilus assembly PilX N-terminal domain-containing protein [Desulfotomaculaceae bacterium]
MIKFLQSAKGMAMPLALVIMFVVSIVGVTIWHGSASDALQVERDENSAQAYYYAKSGVEIALGRIMENIGSYKPGDEEGPFYGKLGDAAFSTSPTKDANGNDDYNIEFKITMSTVNGEDEFYIRSKGYVRSGGARGVQAASSSLGYKIKRDALVAGGMPPLDMIYSLEDITLDGSSKIVGDTGTNSTERNSVKLAWSTNIEGKLFIGPGGDPDAVIDAKNPSGNLPQGSAVSASVRNYPLPQFPEFPTSIPEQEDISLSGKASKTISEDGYFSKIEIKADTTLTIDTGSGDRIIRVGTLDMPQGHIVLRGTGRLFLYVDDYIFMQGSSTINNNGDSNRAFLYYNGSGDLEWSGNQKVYGSAYINNADLAIGGSASITGHIVSGGDSVNVTGGAAADVRAIYAPYADLKLTGSGEITGVVVAKRISLSGNSRITYNDSMDSYFLEQLEWGSESDLSQENFRVYGEWTD